LLDGVAADQAVVPDLHRGLAEAEAHPLQLGVADFVLGGADAALVPAGVAGDVPRAVADGGAGAVHGRVAHPDDGDVVPQPEGLAVGQVVDAEGGVAQAFALNVHGVGVPQARADEDALVAVPEQVVDGQGAADLGVGAHLDPLQLQVAVLEVVQHAVGQAVVGDAVPHDAAGLVPGLEDGDVVAPAGQQHRDGQARRARPDDGRPHPVFGGGARHHLVGVGGGDVVFDHRKVDRVVAGHPVADAVALALLFVVADQAAHGGQGVIFKQHPAGLVHLAGFQQADGLGDIGVDGAALLAHGLFAAKAAVGFVQNV